ncbi:alanine--tRNA ligase [Candidatus Parcubacteria bacterium]|nr:alanine--tRNA ligase [Candidatus Parcubacteria bacterium]
MKSNEIRQKYLDFFESKKHSIISSASIIPENDSTTLFTGSGMQPMVPYLLGEKHPLGTRVANSQKCFRTDDIKDIGDNRHTTFFEMLGNWSLGDYFKAEQIDWIFDFLIKELKFNPNKLYISVYRGNDNFNISKDSEAVELWQNKFKSVGVKAEAVDNAEINGMKNGRIFYYNEKENWWSRTGVPENMPNNELGGPDSEMFWDFGEHLGLHEKSEWKDKPCHPACDCGRFLEIGNNVFMQFIKTSNGFKELKNKNIDFGGGLERIVVAMTDNPDVFLCDLFTSARKEIERLSKTKYGQNENDTKSFRIIMDHIRAAVFLIGDGAHPSNKDQGYFTRRLIRRAVRSAYDLNINSNFTSDVAKIIIDEYSNHYSNLSDKEKVILDEMEKEESKFRKTLKEGLKQFKKRTDITGQEIFNLYQSYGFPIELSFEELDKEKIKYDKIKLKKEFEEYQKKHQELSRTASAGKFKGGLVDSEEKTTKLHTATHLLLAALREVLGDHVIQKGSNITAERLRFDFLHSEKMSSEEKSKVEDLVNEAINKNLEVLCEEMPLEEAKEKGAMGIFESKYGEKVNVYSIGPKDNKFSYEICRGPHVKNTSELGEFKIKKEQSSSSGVRRIKAILK